MNTRLYTVDETLKALTALEMHFAVLGPEGDPNTFGWCMDCVIKHTYELWKLADEGTTFFPENPDPWRRLGAWCKENLDKGDLIIGQGEKLCETARQFRKQDFVAIALQERRKKEQPQEPQEEKTIEDFTVVCAWCGKIMKEGGEDITHGICEKCQAEKDEELKLWKSEGVDEPLSYAGLSLPAPRKTTASPEMKDRIHRFRQAVQTCKTTVVHLEGLKKMQPYTLCMKKELEGGK